MNAPSQPVIRSLADELEVAAKNDCGPEGPGRGAVQTVGRDTCVARNTGASALSTLQQLEHLLRQRVGLGHHCIAGLLQNLCPAQGGGF